MAAIFLLVLQKLNSFPQPWRIRTQRILALYEIPNNNRNQLQYLNPLTQIFSNLLPSQNSTRSNSLQSVRFKAGKLPLEKFAARLSKALEQREWFVTGDADASFFDENFIFEDPDVKVSGLAEYCAGVRRIFNQDVSRAEIVRVEVNSTLPNALTVTWRLSGAVNIAYGFKIKPFIVYTDFTISPTSGLIVAQKDRFSIPGYDIVLSAFLPSFVVKRIPFLSPPAADIDTLKKQYS